MLQAFQKEDLFAHVATLLLDVASSAPPAPKSNYDVSEAGASKENEDEAGPAPPLAPALVSSSDAENLLKNEICCRLSQDLLKT